MVECLEDRTVLSPTDPFLLTPVPEGTPLAMHIHPHLDLFIDGQAVGIPAGIGITPAGDLPLHTHDASGLIHIESPIVRTFYLQDWFTVWQTTSFGQQVAGEINSAIAAEATVNGQMMPSWQTIVLHDHDQIVMQVLSNHPDAATATNEAFVNHVYQDLLGRGADPDGLVVFTTALDQGMSRADMVQGLETSAEYHTLLVNRAYESILGRPVDPSGMAYVGFLGSGGTIEQMESQLFGSAEYFNHAGGTTEAFLSSLYGHVLDRSLDPLGASAAETALADGTPREAIAANVLGSAEAERLRIDGYYQQFFHRPADPTGVAGNMAAYAAGARDEAIIAGILASPEYFPLTAS
jgi:hypothetical protein